MANVTKCDNCDVLDDLTNPVLRRHQTITLHSDGLTIVVQLPPRFNAKNAELCERCIAEMLSARFVELVAMLAPYRPARTVGLDQRMVVEQSREDNAPELSASEQSQLLALLSRRLLRA